MNYSWIIFSVCFCLLAAGQRVDAQSVKVKNKIDWDIFMQRQDMIWETLPEYWYESAFMGNGMLGLMVYKEPDKNYIRLETGRCDVEDHRPGGGCLNTPRLLTGHFALRPQGSILGGSMRLDLWNAETTACVNTTQGTIELRALVHANQMVMLVDVQASEGERGFRWEWIPADAQSPRYLFSKTKESWFKADDYRLNPAPEVKSGLSIQKLNAGGETAIAWKEEARKAVHTYYITIAHSFPQLTAVQEAEQNLVEAMQTGQKKLIKRHREWWHAFYPKSFLTLPDVQKENFYWAQMYKYGSATRSDRALIDNCGPWLAVTPWPNAWWNLNVQLTYWALNASNHLDLAASLENALYNHTDNLKKNLPVAYRDDAIGIACTSNLDCLSEEVADPVKDKGAQIGLLNWACHNLWLIYRYKMDDTLLREKLFPLLKQATNHYRHFLRRGNDGKLHLPSTYSPEYGNAEDCNFNLALINWGCKTLLEIADRLQINDELIPVWKEILRDLTPYPIMPGQGLMIGRDVPYVHSHRHYSHLLAAYPLYLVNRDDPEEYKLIDESLKYWQSKSAAHRGYSYTGAASIAAALGKGNDALNYLNKLFEHFGEMNFMSVNTLYRESGPVIETPLSGAQSIHDMLLQSWGGKLRIFPAVPDEWKDLAFQNMRTEGAFLITASRKGGKTEFFSVKSLAGEPCIIVTDITVPVFTGKRNFNVTRLQEGVYQIDLKKSEEVIVYPQGVKPTFTIEAIKYFMGNSFGKKCKNINK
ncbi:glycosyl hydrolase family 95 catalytic domain-containing protein [Bacteroides thetaiotaomicron]|uniref:glycosyl hydrolase family 95 catalytic domain-containing protein n=1 Tax=Bacteroides thetaiotaomicron TaxID=818 RepID=UPI001F258039|nr:alpha-L-fucosidase [Bacteroides thetaiotaomicron]MCE8491254.1 alpha-L-fucosidase [Bacteroides thetaiotaomicron]